LRSALRGSTRGFSPWVSGILPGLGSRSTIKEAAPMTVDFSDPLRVAIEAARVAGGLLRQEFHRTGGPRGVDGHAEVDLLAEQSIRQRLTSAFPRWGYLGEETGGSLGDDGRYLWLVDPNSGTSAYLAGQRGSAVSIALLAEQVPVLGVVFVFASPDGEGDLFAWAEGCGPLRRQGRETVRPAWPPRLSARDVVLLSEKAELNPGGPFPLHSSGPLSGCAQRGPPSGAGGLWRGRRHGLA